MVLQDQLYDWLGAQEERLSELEMQAQEEEGTMRGVTQEDPADEQGAPKRARRHAEDVLHEEAPSAQGQAGSAAALHVSISEGAGFWSRPCWEGFRFEIFLLLSLRP